MAAADSREAEPQREMSCEFARDDQRAGNNHKRRENTQKESFCVSSQFFGSDCDGYQGQSDGQRPKPAEAEVFHGASRAL